MAASGPGRVGPMKAVGKRFGAVTITVVALALTIVGVVVAITDHNPSGLAKDPFALNGYPPSTAQLALTMRSGTGAGLSALLNVDFHNGRVDANVQFPMVFTSISEEVRLIKGQLYLRNANVAQGPWLALSAKSPNFFGLSLEMVRPDIALITGLTKRVHRQGYQTIYTFSKRSIALTTLGVSGRSTLGSFRWVITTGAYGEVDSSMIAVSSGRRVTTLSLTVLSYNKPVQISEPSAKNVHRLSNSLLRQLMKTLGSSGVMLPNVAQLSTGTVA